MAQIGNARVDKAQGSDLGLNRSKARRDKAQGRLEETYARVREENLGLEEVELGFSQEEGMTQKLGQE